MKCLVTGGTGFLGRHLVRQLLAEGHEVRVLVRKDALSLEREGAELVRGDVLDEASLGPACDGVETVFHLAGRVEHTPGEPTELYRLHIEGTRLMLAAAEQAKVGRFVHMSSSGTIAVQQEDGRIPNEDVPYALEAVRHWPYYLSKIYAEKVALEAHRRGRIPVVVVNPSLLLGPEDESLGSSLVILRFLRREVPAVPPGGLNFVDVRDAATATVAAATKGRPGERYLLGGQNMTVEAFFVLLSKVTGIRPPAVRVSHGVNDAAVSVLSALETVGGFTGDESFAYAMAGCYWYLDASKAKQELGFRPRSGEQTLRDAVAWIRSQGPLPEVERHTMGALVRGLQRVLGRA